MTPEEKRAAEARIKEIGEEIKRLQEERVEINRRLILDVTRPARERLSEPFRRRAAALRARAAREANRDPNPPHWLDAHEERHDQEEGVA